MEKWTYTKYRNPYLDIENVYALENKLVVLSSVDSFDIEIAEDQNHLAEIQSVLDHLRVPSHLSWKKIKEDENEIVSNVLMLLDEQSLFMNKDDDIEHVLDEQINDMERQIDKTVELLAEKMAAHTCLSNEHLMALANACAYQLKLLHEDMGIEVTFKCLPCPDKNRVDNFFITTLLYQLKYLRKSHPLALLAWLVTLCRLCQLICTSIPVETIDFFCFHWKEIALHWIGGAFDIKEITVYQASLASHLINSIKENAKSIFLINDFEENFSTSSSGINFMIKVERAVNEILAKRGRPSLFQKLDTIQHANDPLVKGIFIEQYHVNRRFIEILTPLLNKRLSDQLRKRMYQYYEEEYGHEELELKTCLSLGIAELDLMSACSLPLMQAYVDAFTVVADADPIAFFSSAMITEGMIGKPSSLYDCLEGAMADNLEYLRVARNHENLNVDLNHAYLSRLFMGDINVISPTTQRNIMKHVLYLLELNHRSLEQMTEYYSSQEKLIFYHGLENGIV